jgi:hypothetical protein
VFEIAANASSGRWSVHRRELSTTRKGVVGCGFADLVAIRIARSRDRPRRRGPLPEDRLLSRVRCRSWYACARGEDAPTGLPPPYVFPPAAVSALPTATDAWTGRSPSLLPRAGRELSPAATEILFAIERGPSRGGPVRRLSHGRAPAKVGGFSGATVSVGTQSWRTSPTRRRLGEMHGRVTLLTPWASAPSPWSRGPFRGVYAAS